jgi:GNAT superfamily N-acetyltransferase
MSPHDCGIMRGDSTSEIRMSDRIAIRPAAATDAATLAVLLAELGYPTDADQAVARVARLAADPRAIALVACDGDTVCGLATVHAHDNLNRDEPSVQLTLLVTASGVRGSGVGRALVAAAEAWTERHGARRLVVTTAVHRAGAHAFYERLGYTLTGRRYTRTW